MYKQQEERKATSKRHADKLTQIGMGVHVVRDDGTSMMTTLESLPWPVAGGYWIARVAGISGGYDCARIRPAVEVGKAVA
jgi:hypothetical protein